MPAYHSAHNWVNDAPVVGSISFLPFHTRLRGYNLAPADTEKSDIIAESLDLFRPNSLFRNFEIQGPGDRLLIYLILFIGDCLARIAQAKTWTKNEAAKQLAAYAVDNFALPGEPGFPINSMYAAPGSRLEAESLRHYLTLLRQEAALRLVERIYLADGKPSKWWMAFQKHRFMGIQSRVA